MSHPISRVTMLSALEFLLACEDPAPTPTPSATPATEGTPAPNGNAGGPPNGGQSAAGGAPNAAGGPPNAAGGPPNGANGAPDGAAPATISLPAQAIGDALAADTTIPKNPGDLKALKAKGQTWSDDQIRNYYLRAVAQTARVDADAKKSGKSAEERAKAAFAIRHDARALARLMMADAAKVATLKAADQQKFGDPDGPDFNHLVKKVQGKGLSGDAAYEDVLLVIQSKPDLDKALGL